MGINHLLLAFFLPIFILFISLPMFILLISLPIFILFISLPMFMLKMYAQNDETVISEVLEKEIIFSTQP